MTEEPIITINGVLCTSAMAATIRCAVENFGMDLKNHGLGDDEHGKEMTRLYLERIAEIHRLFFYSNDN